MSQATLESASLPEGKPGQFTNDEAGIAGIVKWLKGRPVERVVLEATGGYETTLAAGLAAAGLPVVVIHPKRVRDFAKASGILAKTDKIDARGLARFGEGIPPPIRPLPDEAHQLAAVMADLDAHREADTALGGTPVRHAYRHIANRPGQFGYPQAIAAQLPIGSGEIESAHRYVIQKRLKLPGAWWRPDNALAMLNLLPTRQAPLDRLLE